MKEPGIIVVSQMTDGKSNKLVEALPVGMLRKIPPVVPFTETSA